MVSELNFPWLNMGHGKNTRQGEATEGEGTSNELQKLEVNLKTLLEEHSKKIDVVCTTQNSHIAQNTKAIADVNDLVLGLTVQISKLVNGGRDGSSGTSFARTPETPVPPYQYSTRLTKIEFPKFEGSDLNSWMYKCNQFFDLDNVNDTQKVKLVAIHLEGRALLWHQNYIKSRPNPT